MDLVWPRRAVILGLLQHPGSIISFSTFNFFFFFFGLLIFLVLYTGVYRKDFGGNSILELLFDFVDGSIGVSV